MEIAECIKRDEDAHVQSIKIRRCSIVVYKRIENNQVRLIKFHYTDEKLSSLDIN